jgi:hypothetical protein
MKRKSATGRRPARATARKGTAKKGSAKAIGRLKKPARRRKTTRKPSTMGTASGRIVPQLPSEPGDE